jgi:flagellar biosynthesis anti-sigma factor FlgM
MPTSPTNGAQRGSDEVQFSDSARLLSKLRELPDIRQDKIDQVRQAIDDGTYDTDDKVDAMLEALMEDLA